MKIKFVFILDNGVWNYAWHDYDGYQDMSDYIDAMIEYEQKIINNYLDDKVNIIHGFVVNSHPADDGKYQCGSCGHYFDEPDGEDTPYCPYCGSGNFVEGCIDEPEISSN